MPLLLLTLTVYMQYMLCYNMWHVGLPDVDLDDLRANTEYQGYKATDPQVEFFWSVYIVYSICMLYGIYIICFL